MEIIIAVIGILFLVFKLGKEKTDTRIGMTDNAVRENKLNAWIAESTDEKLEQQLERDIDEQGAYLITTETEKVYDELFKEHCFADVCPKAMWPEKARNNYDPVFAEKQIRLREDFALRIMMAKRGKLLKRDIGGYGVGGDERRLNTTLQIWLSDLDLLIMQWCANEVKKHGVRGELVIRPVRANQHRKAYWIIDE